MERTEIPVVVLAKSPVPGQVKTRLTGGERGALDERVAAALARAFLADTCARVRALPWARGRVATTGALPAAIGELPVSDQGDGDLGARIERVLRAALADAPAAIAIGADTPGLPPALLDQARAALRAHDAVIGPTDDGGFYLLGLRRCEPGLLADLPWSAPTTYADTLARLRTRGLSAHVLDRWFDVDRPADLPRLRALLDARAIEAPATRRALAAARVSVVMPVLDEAARLRGALEALTALAAWREVIVVDGGSIDGSAAIARGHAEDGVRVIDAARGRGRQLGAGAAAATGEILLFLHADTRLPADALDHIDAALAEPDVVAGAFRTWTVAEPPAPWFAPLLHLADLRSRITHLPYGDQAVFVRATAFRAAGGFPDAPILEDLELARRLARLGRIATCRASVQVSGRRFVARPIYYTAVVNVIPILYRLGVPAAALARLYHHVR